LQLRRLEYFTAIARCLNFHTAAESVGVSQPALSMQLKKLELELGVRLLERDNRRVELTPAGRDFAQRMTPLLAEVKTITADLTRLSAVEGKALVGSGVLGSVRLPAVVNSFRDRYPKIDLVLRQQPSDETVALVRRGALDVGVLLVFPPVWRPPAELAVENKSAVHIGVLLRPNHRLAGAREVRLEDIEPERLILSSSTSSAPRLAVESAMKASKFRPEFTPSETMTSALAALVAQGMGVAITTEATAANTGKLVFRPLADVPACRIVIVWNKRRPRSPAADVFLQYLRAWDWDPAGVS